MIRRIDLRGKLGSRNLSKRDYQALIPRAGLSIESVAPAVMKIIERVKSGNEQALLDLSEEFDAVRSDSIRTPRIEIDKALKALSPDVKSALEESIKRIRKVHESQRREESRVDVAPGGSVIERWVPVDRVGLYVPGGRAVYPSSVMMNVIPAQIAGVKSIALFSPPQADNDGWPHPTILAAAAILGIDEIYSLGGATAIAAAAYGVRDSEGELILHPCDLVTGPGNIYVAAAKRALRGVIGIDSEAGPTEIAIVADEMANPQLIAVDLISQAEHDVVAAAVLITNSLELADQVEKALAHHVALTKHKERITEALSGVQSAIVLVSTIEEGIELVNAYAAEHLELHLENSREWAKKIRNAGAVFIGNYSPVSLGDYSAGSNHVLPTGGCACHSSGLSVQTFLRGIHFIEYSKEALQDIAATVVLLANAEDLPAHGQAVNARFENDE
jgi:histidinol dehydrogenase